MDYADGALAEGSILLKKLINSKPTDLTGGENLYFSDVFLCEAKAPHIFLLGAWNVPQTAPHRDTIDQLAPKDSINDHHQPGGGEDGQDGQR